MPVRRRTKPCPFCGNYLEEKRITDFTNGVEVIVEYVHPMANCILSGYEVFEKEVYQWNRRAEDG